MVDSNSNQFKRIILTIMGADLKTAGFRKNKALFALEQNDTTLFVQLQSSMKTTKDVLVVTVNLGIFSRSVAESVGNTHEPNIYDAQWRARIGCFLPGGSDKWWEVRSEQDAEACGLEITKLLIDKALPEMRRLASTESSMSL